MKRKIYRCINITFELPVSLRKVRELIRATGCIYDCYILLYFHRLLEGTVKLPPPGKYDEILKEPRIMTNMRTDDCCEQLLNECLEKGFFKNEDEARLIALIEITDEQKEKAESILKGRLTGWMMKKRNKAINT